jgi:hypothetical protein
MRLLNPESIRGQKTSARLRKAYVAAKLSDYADRKTRARRSVAKEAWADRLDYWDLKASPHHKHQFRIRFPNKRWGERGNFWKIYSRVKPLE